MRTIQRWCKAGDLPGARKVGRSWRIPTQAIRVSKVGRADGVERELRAARVACEQLKRELEVAKSRGPVERNWRSTAREIEKLREALDGLPPRPSEVPGFLEAQSDRRRARGR